MAIGSSFGWAFLLGLKFGTKTNLFGRMEGLLFSLTEMKSQGRCRATLFHNGGQDPRATLESLDLCK